MFSNQNRNGAAFHTHRCAQIMTARQVCVRNVFLLANGRQMAHNFNRRNIAGEQNNSGKEKKIIIRFSSFITYPYWKLKVVSLLTRFRLSSIGFAHLSTHFARMSFASMLKWKHKCFISPKIQIRSAVNATDWSYLSLSISNIFWLVSLVPLAER